jgi:hypothetical protein
MSAVLFRTTRRVIAASVVLGCLAEFLVWVTTYTANSDPYTAGEYPWLDRLQEPGVRFGVFFGLHVWRAFGRPEYHLLFYAYVGSVSCFALLITLWSIVAFTLPQIARRLLLRREKAKYPLPQPHAT